MTTIADKRATLGLSQRSLAKGLSEALGRPIRAQTIAKWERDGSAPDDVLAVLDGNMPPVTAAPEATGTGSERDPGPGGLADRPSSPEGDGQDEPEQPPRGNQAIEKAIAVVPRRELEKRIRSFYDSCAFALAFLNPADAEALKSISAPAAEAWADLCQTNPKVMRVWQLLTRPGGAWGQLALIHAPVIVAVLANHNLLPELSLFPKEPTHGQQPHVDSPSPVGEPAGHAAS